MATVVYTKSDGSTSTYNFTPDENPLVTPGEIDLVLGQIPNAAACGSCTFTFDRFNSAQKFTFDELLAWKNQAGVRLNQPLGNNGVIVNAPAGEKFPAGSTIVLQHHEDGAVEGEPVLLTMARSWVKLLPPEHRFSRAGTYSIRLYGPGETVTHGQLGGNEIGVIQVGNVQAVVTPEQAPPPRPAPAPAPAAQTTAQSGEYTVGIPVGGSGLVVKKDSGKWPAGAKVEIYVDGQLKDTRTTLTMARSWVRVYQATDTFDQAGTYSIRIQGQDITTFVVSGEGVQPKPLRFQPQNFGPFAFGATLDKDLTATVISGTIPRPGNWVLRAMKKSGGVPKDAAIRQLPVQGNAVILAKGFNFPSALDIEGESIDLTIYYEPAYDALKKHDAAQVVSYLTLVKPKAAEPAPQPPPKHVPVVFNTDTQYYRSLGNAKEEVPLKERIKAEKPDQGNLATSSQWLLVDPTGKEMRRAPTTGDILPQGFAFTNVPSGPEKEAEYRVYYLEPGQKLEEALLVGAITVERKVVPLKFTPITLEIAEAVKVGAVTSGKGLVANKTQGEYEVGSRWVVRDWDGHAIPTVSAEGSMKMPTTGPILPVHYAFALRAKQGDWHYTAYYEPASVPFNPNRVAKGAIVVGTITVHHVQKRRALVWPSAETWTFRSGEVVRGNVTVQPLNEPPPQGSWWVIRDESGQALQSYSATGPVLRNGRPVPRLDRGDDEATLTIYYEPKQKHVNRQQRHEHAQAVGTIHLYNPPRFAKALTWKFEEGVALTKGYQPELKSGVIPEGGHWAVREAKTGKLIEKLPATGPVFAKGHAFTDLSDVEGPVKYAVTYVPRGLSVQENRGHSNEVIVAHVEINIKIKFADSELWEINAGEPLAKALKASDHRGHLARNGQWVFRDRKTGKVVLTRKAADSVLPKGYKWPSLGKGINQANFRVYYEAGKVDKKTINVNAPVVGTIRVTTPLKFNPQDKPWHFQEDQPVDRDYAPEVAQGEIPEGSQWVIASFDDVTEQYYIHDQQSTDGPAVPAGMTFTDLPEGKGGFEYKIFYFPSKVEVLLGTFDPRQVAAVPVGTIRVTRLVKAQLDLKPFLAEVTRDHPLTNTHLVKIYKALGWSDSDLSDLARYVDDVKLWSSGGKRTGVSRREGSSSGSGEAVVLISWRRPYQLDSQQRRDVQAFYQRLIDERIPVEAGIMDDMELGLQVYGDYSLIDSHIKGRQLLIQLGFEDQLAAKNFEDGFRRLSRWSVPIDAKDLDPAHRAEHPYTYFEEVTDVDREGRRARRRYEPFEGLYVKGSQPPHFTLFGALVVNFWLRSLAERSEGQNRLTAAARDFLLQAGAAQAAVDQVPVEEVRFDVEWKHYYAGQTLSRGMSLQTEWGQMRAGGQVVLWDTPLATLRVRDEGDEYTDITPVQNMEVTSDTNSVTFLEDWTADQTGAYTVKYYPPGEEIRYHGGYLARRMDILSRVPIAGTNAVIGVPDSRYVATQPLGGEGFILWLTGGSWPLGQFAVAAAGIPLGNHTQIVSQALAVQAVQDPRSSGQVMRLLEAHFSDFPNFEGPIDSEQNYSVYFIPEVEDRQGTRQEGDRTTAAWNHGAKIPDAQVMGTIKVVPFLDLSSEVERVADATTFRLPAQTLQVKAEAVLTNGIILAAQGQPFQEGGHMVVWDRGGSSYEGSVVLSFPVSRLHLSENDMRLTLYQGESFGEPGTDFEIRYYPRDVAHEEPEHGYLGARVIVTGPTVAVSGNPGFTVGEIHSRYAQNESKGRNLMVQPSQGRYAIGMTFVVVDASDTGMERPLVTVTVDAEEKRDGVELLRWNMVLKGENKSIYCLPADGSQPVKIGSIEMVASTARRPAAPSGSGRQ
jgi:hypothetical protein